MLQIAIEHENELIKLFRDTWFDDRFQYFYMTSWRFGYKANADDTWKMHEFVSMLPDDKTLVGYLAYSIDRDDLSAYELQIINFKPEYNLVFALDLKRFLQDIFEKFHFRKVKWSVIIGNPIEPSYDKLCLQNGGRIVGIYKNDVKLMNGSYADRKLYEIINKNYHC